MLSEKLYFAYGSNMNLNQMAFRCPEAEVVGVVRVDDYRLTFCGSREAMLTVSSGAFPKQMKSTWTSTKAFLAFTGRNLLR